VAALIAAAALTSMNATIVTGSRTAFALGRDFHVFRKLGRWNDRAAAPVPALLVHGSLVVAWSRSARSRATASRPWSSTPRRSSGASSC
jgi:amino acid transporter